MWKQHTQGKDGTSLVFAGEPTIQCFTLSRVGTLSIPAWLIYHKVRLRATECAQLVQRPASLILVLGCGHTAQK